MSNLQQVCHPSFFEFIRLYDIVLCIIDYVFVDLFSVPKNVLKQDVSICLVARRFYSKMSVL